MHWRRDLRREAEELFHQFGDYTHGCGVDHRSCVGIDLLHFSHERRSCQRYGGSPRSGIASPAVLRDRRRLLTPRLRRSTEWPASHPGCRPFFFVDDAHRRAGENVATRSRPETPACQHFLGVLILIPSPPVGNKNAFAETFKEDRHS
jgi:hypothetical protein